MPADAEIALRAAIEERIRAVRAKDANAVLSHYAADVTTFDLVAPLENVGTAAVRQRLVGWFDSFDGPLGYEIAHLQLVTSGEIAFDHHFTHVRGATRDGKKIDMWFRETLGYRFSGGRWLVTHQHTSVPFDMTSLRAEMSLQPLKG
jgi:ketosteroid isomerase-like protein